MSVPNPAGLGSHHLIPQNGRSMGPALVLTQPPSWGTAPVRSQETAQIWLSCSEGPCPLPPSPEAFLCVTHTHCLLPQLSRTLFLDLSLILFGGWLSQRVRNLPFVPTTLRFGSGVCVLLVCFSMLVVFILKPWLVYTCVCAILPQLWACLTLVERAALPPHSPEPLSAHLLMLYKRV